MWEFYPIARLLATSLSYFSEKVDVCPAIVDKF
jgi:hypothetical protein